jgi:hypothetical protein
MFINLTLKQHYLRKDIIEKEENILLSSKDNTVESKLS